MPEQPLISIIIPTFNRAHLLSETLDSVLAQTYTNWECIVVDDGSTDATEALVETYIKKDARFLFFKRPNTHLPGGNGARNYGVKKSNGDYLQWFDSDDLMHPEKLEVQINVLAYSNKMFSVCQTLQFEGTIDNIIGLRSKQIYSKNPLVSYIRSEIVLLTPSPIFKKKFIIENKLYFDENLKAAQEWEFFSRCLLISNDYEVENRALIYIRRHDTSITSNDKKVERYWFYYLARLKAFKTLKNTAYYDALETYFFDYYKKSFFRFMDAKDFVKAKSCLKNSIKKCFSKGEYYKAWIYFILMKTTGKGYFFKNKIFNI
ncbi:MAG: glycosyltransferase family 2 protein [Oceanihabitans sp.]|nr:glycosyltransferase family 2 protein [Oceanihabitans sp.]